MPVPTLPSRDKRATRFVPDSCQRRTLDEGWRTCEYCGSMWHPELFGEEWKPLSCVERRT